MPNSTNSYLTFATIVLASGLSERLGQPKQLLAKPSFSKRNQPLLAYAVSLTQALLPKPTVSLAILPATHPNLEAMQDCLKGKAVTTVLNPIPQMGMGNSLKLGITSLQEAESSGLSHPCGWVLILGVDQVLLDSRHLQTMLNQIGSQSTQTADGEALSVIASRYVKDSARISPNNTISEPTKTHNNASTEKVIGLPVLVQKDVLFNWQSELAGDKGLRHLIRALPNEAVICVDNDRLAIDIDTPEQLAMAREKGWVG